MRSMASATLARLLKAESRKLALAGGAETAARVPTTWASLSSRSKKAPESTPSGV